MDPITPIPIDVADVARTQFVKYVCWAASTVLVYDWLLLISDELTFVWNSPRSFVKTVYLLVRYPTFIDVPLTLAYLMVPSLDSGACMTIFRLGICFFAIGVAITELIPMWRTYALWNRSRAIRNTMTALWLIFVIGNFYPVVRFVYHVRVANLPGLDNCHLVKTRGEGAVFIGYASLLLLELVTVSLTLFQGFRSFRGMTSTLVVTLYRDGIVFFLVMTGFSLGSVLGLALGPINYVELLSTLTRVAHTVLSCRVIIHLRSADRKDTEAQTTASIISSALEFETPPSPSPSRQLRETRSVSVYSMESAVARQRSIEARTESTSVYSEEQV